MHASIGKMDHAIGQFETRANVLRARLWLLDKERQKLEARPTFDADSGWLHVVSEEDATSEAIHGAAHPGRVRDEAAEEAGEPDETAAAAGGDAAEGVAEDAAEGTGKDAPELAAGEEQ